MGGVNKILLVGNLGRKPELRYTPAGQPVCEFGLAVNETYFDKDQRKHERTEWCNIVVWGKLAEACEKHLEKGKQIYLEGRLQTRSWEDKDGQKRYKTEVVAKEILFLGGGRKRDEFDPDRPPANQDEPMW